MISNSLIKTTKTVGNYCSNYKERRNRKTTRKSHLKKTKLMKGKLEICLLANIQIKHEQNTKARIPLSIIQIIRQCWKPNR